MEKPAPTIRELYPHLSDEQLRAAEDNLAQYLALALRVYERCRAAQRSDDGQRHTHEHGAQ